MCLSADVTPLHLSAAVTDCHLDVQEISSSATPHSRHLYHHQGSLGSKDSQHSTQPFVSSLGREREDRGEEIAAAAAPQQKISSSGVIGKCQDNAPRHDEGFLAGGSNEKREDADQEVAVQCPDPHSSARWIKSRVSSQDTSPSGDGEGKGSGRGLPSGSGTKTRVASPRNPRVSAAEAGMAGARATTNAQGQSLTTSLNTSQTCEYSPVVTRVLGGGGEGGGKSSRSTVMSDAETTAFSASSYVTGTGGMHTPGARAHSTSSTTAGTGSAPATGGGNASRVSGVGGVGGHSKFPHLPSGIKESDRGVFSWTMTANRAGPPPPPPPPPPPSSSSPGSVFSASGSGTRGVEPEISPTSAPSFASLGGGGGGEGERGGLKDLQQPETILTAARLLASPMVGGLHSTGSITTTLLPTKPLILIIITGGTICMDYGGEQSSMRPRRLAQRLETLPELKDPNLPLFDVLEWDTLVDSSEVGLPHWKLLAQQIFTFYGDYDG